jgi:hypothetical protein
MRDVAIITPTRLRPENAQRLINAVAATSTLKTDLILAIDEDDDSYSGLKCNRNVIVARGPRKTCIEWTNALAETYAGQYRALASFGDDHEPQTYDWDGRFLGALAEMGGTGIVYGNDTLQGEYLPTAPVISSDIPLALGWLMYPRFVHFFADNVWKDIAREAGCLRYLPQVTIRHYHCAFGTAPVDSTYIEAAPAWQADEPVYRAWHQDPDGLAAAVQKVRALCQRGAS